MSFVSFEFILFLGLLFAAYYLIPKRYQWMLLLAASYLFYSFAGLQFMAYLLITTGSTYLIGRQLQRLRDREKQWFSEHQAGLSRQEKRSFRDKARSVRWRWLLLCLLINFGLLGVLKYGNFTIGNINALLQVFGSGKTLTFMNLALPLGISFYTFQSMGYVIDVHRGKYPAERNIFRLALFVSFFPQLIQGPISRYDDLAQSLYQPHGFDRQAVSYGLQRILWGYFKKMVIADRIVVAVSTIIGDPQQYQGSYVLIAMVYYAVQLYADFTGGIDITIGIAQMLGIKVTENFQRPFFAKSITEYWRRWHITLGTWFKEYLFYPISVSQPMLRLSGWARKHLGDAVGKRLPVYLATILVWLTTGIWHGASWNFVAWGMANCLVILVSQEMIPLYRRFHARFSVQQTTWFRLFQVTRMFWIMCSIRIFDIYRDIGTALSMYTSVFTRFKLEVFTDGSLLQLGLNRADYLVLLAGIVLLAVVSLVQRSGGVRERIRQRPFALRYALYSLLLIAILLFGAYGIGYDSTQFIYNQF